jgi:dTDP-4-amino-4,6-dideoxygalactose transaminase
MRLHGIDRTIWARYPSPASPWAYKVVAAGYKYNMTALSAAIGREQLKKADAFLARRRKIAETYTRAFGSHPRLEIPRPAGDHAWHLYILRLVGTVPGERDLLLNRLREEGIGVSVHYIPLHLMPYYRDLYRLEPEDFPNALDTYRRSFSLPIYPGMQDRQVDRVIRAVENSIV